MLGQASQRPIEQRDIAYWAQRLWHQFGQRPQPRTFAGRPEPARTPPGSSRATGSYRANSVTPGPRVVGVRSDGVVRQELRGRRCQRRQVVQPIPRRLEHLGAVDLQGHLRGRDRRLEDHIDPATAGMDDGAGRRRCEILRAYDYAGLLGDSRRNPGPGLAAMQQTGRQRPAHARRLPQ